MAKIFPRNLPAQRYALSVVGNPVTTRLESGVSNCYPGLEFDHRNLDRRFFPGLVVNFASSADPTIPDARAGAHVYAVDLTDPALAEDADTSQTLAAAQIDLGIGAWFITSIAQGGKTISCLDEHGKPLDGAVVWNMVHGLVRDDVTVVVTYRPATPAPTTPPTNTEYTFSARRRAYVDDDSGEFAVGFQAGELTQSLCSPWQHDFRDCGCDYWSSNHPDIVLAPNAVGGAVLPSGAPADPDRATLLVDWLRYDRGDSGLAQAPGTRAGVRPYQIDHYWINQNWQTLSFVLRGREIGSTFRTPEADTATPYDTPDDLAKALVAGAGVEHVVALIYLYARYSIKSDDELAAGGADQTLRDVAAFTKHELLMIAVSEMRHLRWVNQLLWELHVKNGLLTKPIAIPALGVAEKIPLGHDAQGNPLPDWPRRLGRFDEDTVAHFVQLEAPSGAIDGLYAQTVSTLRAGIYPPGLRELAAQIVADGVAHYSRFQQLVRLVQFYFDEAKKTGKPIAFLRDITPGSPADPRVAPLLQEYRDIVANLTTGYQFGDPEDAGAIVKARELMTKLDGDADELAAKYGLGVPFF